MLCPICRTSMIQTRRAATLTKRGPAYYCPAGDAEIDRVEVAPGRFHLIARPDRQHENPSRVWAGWELPRVVAEYDQQDG